MTLPSKATQQVDEIGAEVDRLLKAVDPAPFSDPAFSLFKGKVIQYLSDLRDETRAIVKRDQADAISIKHVEAACEHLMVRNRNKVYRFAGTIGGLGLGVSFSTLCDMVLTSRFPPAGVIICAVSAMIGSFLLAVNIMKD